MRSLVLTLLLFVTGLAVGHLAVDRLRPAPAGTSHSGPGQRLGEGQSNGEGPGGGPPPSGPAAAGWGSVIVRATTGRAPTPSESSGEPGALRPEPSERRAPRPEWLDSASAPTEPDGDTGQVAIQVEPEPLPDLELVVRSGQTLSEIAQEHYGTSRPSLVLALARYNGLEDPDRVRVGATIRLPDRERLGQ